MIITNILGGLGNQMFQYALGRALAKKHGVELKLDITGFEEYNLWNYDLSAFNIIEEFATEKEIKSLKYNFLIKPLNYYVFKIKKFYFSDKYLLEKQLGFDKEVFECSNNTYIEGYWQSEKYFKDIEEELKQDFTLKVKAEGKNKQMLELISSKNAVSLHVRRGDYVSNAKANKTHGTCSLDYYKQAIDYISQRVENPTFFLFSDDIDWVKENLKIDFETVAVDINDKYTGIQDMRLMSACKHHIIANSSFSWWGAWLGHNKDKMVIAPKKWFNSSTHINPDLVPESWIRL